MNEASRQGGLVRLRPSRDARRTTPLALLAIVALALALRVIVIAADSSYQPTNDALEYDYLARSIAAGDGYPPSGYLLQAGPTAVRGPGFPFLLGGVYALSGDSVTAGRLLDALLGAAVVVLLYLIAKRIWGRRVGLLAAAMAAVFPPLVLLSRDLVSESLFLVLELGALLCVLEFRRSGAMTRWAVAAGAICGLAILTRPTGFVLLACVAFGLWTLRSRASLHSLAAPAAGVLCAVLVLTPWLIRDAAEFGRVVPVTTSGGIATSGTYNQASFEADVEPGAWRDPQAIPRFRPLFMTLGLDEASVDVALRNDARDFAWEHPAYVAEATGWNFLRLFEVLGGSVIDRESKTVSERGIGSADPTAERIGIGIAVVLAAVGLFTLLGPWGKGGNSRRRVPHGPLFFWAVPILMLLVTAPIAGLPRYRLPVDPFLLILAAIGLLALRDRLTTSRAPAAGASA